MLKSRVQPGISGNWSVENFEVTEADAKFFNMREAFGGSHRYISPGTYTRLTRNGSCIMSDAPSEIKDHMEVVRMCRFIEKGSILINGLGLGIVLQLLIERDLANEIIVIEKSEDVINLVAPFFTESYIQIIHADAFDWKPPKDKRYEIAWHDIWDNICADNIKPMDRLQRKYRRIAKKQGCWARNECLRQRRNYRV